MLSTYLEYWKVTKKEIEAKTGQKKPSEKFLGVFRTSSGIEAACKGLDDSLKKPSKAGMTKAFDSYKAASKKYIDVLTKAESKGDLNAPGMVVTLRRALGEIMRDYENEFIKHTGEFTIKNPFYEGPKH